MDLQPENAIAPRAIIGYVLQPPGAVTPKWRRRDVLAHTLECTACGESKPTREYRRKGRQCRACLNKAGRERYQIDRERILADRKSPEYRARERENRRALRAANPERARQKRRAYAAANRERLRAISKRDYWKHRERRLAYKARQRAAEKLATTATN